MDDKRRLTATGKLSAKRTTLLHDCIVANLVLFADHFPAAQRFAKQPKDESLCGCVMCACLCVTQVV